jgi:UDP-N-acetylmuramoyl-tripeptide--D-alanyl-D-alanine ligase
VRAANIDRLLLVGEEMDPLADALGDTLPIDRAADADAAAALLKALVAPRDAVLVKASNSIGLARLVEAMAGDPPCSI